MSDSKSSEQSDIDEGEPGDEVVGQKSSEVLYPYPFLGQPYVTKTILNTIDLNLIKEARMAIFSAEVESLQLEVSEMKSEYSLKHVLFQSAKSAFPQISGTSYIDAFRGNFNFFLADLQILRKGSTIPLHQLLPLPPLNDDSEMKMVLTAINGLFSAQKVGSSNVLPPASNAFTVCSYVCMYAC